MMTPEEGYAIIRKHQKKFPVKVVALAKALGARVWKTDGWDEGFSGAIRKDPERGGTDGYAVFVNAHHPIERRRFTIAHEIGHLVLHRELIGDGIADDALYHSGLDSLSEQLANNVAIDVLMPWTAVDQKMKEGIKSIGELAKFFKVTKSVVSIRLSVPYETVAEDLENK